MKIDFKIVVIIVFSLFLTVTLAQTPGEWTWVNGNNTINGVFGTQGVADPANTPPALYEPCEWKDNNGNFWLFGGVQPPAVSNSYSALWKYDVATNQWTWMKGPSAPNQPGVYGVQGVPAPANTPGARSYGIASWTDAAGDLWLFGGNLSSGSGTINDLWKYNIASNQWTWMKGSNVPGNAGSLGTMGVSSPTNLPGASDERSGLGTDNAGNLWLFSGRWSGGDNLWKYDVATNQWTWMKGTNTFVTPAVYGTQGVSAPANTPGTRWPYASWTDQTGDLWFFGAWTQWTNGFSNLANDLWKYTVANNQWTWVKGPNTLNDPGNYGTKCVSAPNNVPPARHENRARVKDACGNFWQFGGASNAGNLNDLWYYNLSSNEWTWISGDNTPNQGPVNGVKGVSAPANKPNASNGGVAWIDNNGYIYVFGGTSFSNNNNMYRYVPPNSFVQTQTNSTTCSPCNGSATIDFTCAVPNYSYVWSTGSSTLNTTSSSNTLNGLCPGTYTVTATSNCNQSKSATFVITGTPCTTCNIAAQFTKGTALCSNCGCQKWVMVNAINGTPPYMYQWSDGYDKRYKNKLCEGTYLVKITDKNGCSVDVNITAP